MAAYVTDPKCQCKGKAVFRSKSEAKRKLRRWRTRRELAKVGVYKCPHCGMFHHGKTSSRVEAARKR